MHLKPDLTFEKAVHKVLHDRACVLCQESHKYGDCPVLKKADGSLKKSAILFLAWYKHFLYGAPKPSETTI